MALRLLPRAVGALLSCWSGFKLMQVKKKIQLGDLQTLRTNCVSTKPLGMLWLQPLSGLPMSVHHQQTVEWDHVANSALKPAGLLTQSPLNTTEGRAGRGRTQEVTARSSINKTGQIL